MTQLSVFVYLKASKASSINLEFKDKYLYGPKFSLGKNGPRQEVRSGIFEMSDRYPLAKYEGARPPAPDWFKRAVATPSQSAEIVVAGTQISFLRWGDQDKPGLLFMHGNSAHANWYDFIAPYFTDNFNVAAVTFSGMGDSGWRDAYSVDVFSNEILAVLKETGMFDHSVKPILAAHSFGGVIALFTAARHSKKLKGIVTLDTPVFHPDINTEKSRPKVRSEHSIFPNQTTALGRFRLLPPQPCDNHFILDHIARFGLKNIEENGSTTSGWSWKFDPMIWSSLGAVDEGLWDVIPTISCKLAFLRGEQSSLISDDVKTRMENQFKAPFISIKNAGHHVFLDNPLDMIHELKNLFATWE